MNKPFPWHVVTAVGVLLITAMTVFDRLRALGYIKSPKVLGFFDKNKRIADPQFDANSEYYKRRPVADARMRQYLYK